MRLSAAGRTRSPLGEVLACALALVAPAVSAMAETVREFECRLGDLARTIEIKRVVPERPLPCEVIYKKPVEEPGVSRVLWDAAHDAAYCEAKAEELVGTLEAGGWGCTSATPATAEPVVVALGGADRSALEPALRQAVVRDLEKLKERGGKRASATIAGIGDLDGDGADDAVALITFDAEGPDRAQYLVAYLFDGGIFRSTASRFIGGRFRDAYDGEVEGIEDGAILVHLRTLKAGDAACCPSGSRRATFVLRDGELVRAE